MGLTKSLGFDFKETWALLSIFFFMLLASKKKKKSFLKAKNGNNLIDVNSYRFAGDMIKQKGYLNFGKWLGNILIVKLPFCLWNFIESKKNPI